MTDFGDFCQVQYPRLVGAMRLQVGDDGVAQEMAQEALARACRDWATVRDMTSPASWVFRVAFNLANSHLRRRLIERRVHDGLRHTAVPATTRTPDDQLVVRDALRRLPRRTRTVLILRYYVDLPVAEIARLMRCPESTVKTLTRRGLQKLRTQPEFQHGGTDPPAGRRPATLLIEKEPSDG
jgi:RNA polymerase sigma-70 factor (ECF subfamily)